MRKAVFLSFIMLLFSSLSVFSFDCGTIVAEPTATSFALVVDQSGSMSGLPLEKAFYGVLYFVREMRPGDMSSIIAFESDVHILSGLTDSKETLYTRAEKLSPPRGSTRLYDAVGSAAKMLAGRPGQRVIIFLTDGNDTSSTLTLRDIRQMNIGEGIFVYGVGLGDVDHESLQSLARATGGVYRTADDPGQIVSLYRDVQQAHYSRVDTIAATHGGTSIASLPSGKPVRVNGKSAGSTPVKLDGMTPGEYDVEVEFDRGVWNCSAVVKAGSRTYISARESDIPADLFIETAPTRAAVFIDDTYMGLSSEVPGFGMNWDRQLCINGLKEGRHTVRIVAAPDFEAGESFKYEFDFMMGSQSRYVKVSVFFRTAEFRNGERIRSGF